MKAKGLTPKSPQEIKEELTVRFSSLMSMEKWQQHTVVGQNTEKI